MKHRADGGGDASSKLYGSFPAAEDPGGNLSADAPAGPAGARSFRGGANPSPPPNARPPSYRKIERGSGDGSGDNDDDDDERVCRICLEEDSPETMIAPCRCKGSSRWVHRECLDEWRTNERDRAFSRCTECLFEYHLEPVFGGESENDNDNDNDNESGNDGCGPIGGCCGRQKRRRCLFYWMVSRDVCTGILLQQLVVVLLGAIVKACDGDRRLPELVSPSLAERSAPAPSYWYYYYGFGWLAFLIATGVCGLVVLCTNGCNLKRAIPRVGPPSEADGEAADAGRERERSRHERSDFRRTGNFYHSGTNYNYTRVDSENDYFYPQQQQQQQQQWRQRQREHERQRRYAASPSTQYYRRARRRHRHYRRRRRYCDDYDDYYYYYGPAYHPVYVYPTGSNDCCYCCCCCCDSRGPSVDVNNIPSGGGCCDCDFGGCMRDVHRSTRSGSNGSNGDGNDAKHVLLVVLLVVAIVLAIVGFFVGVLVVVVAIQRIVARHVHLLQKRQLVQEYRVVDLQDYDLDTPVATAPAEGEAPAGTAGTGSPEGFESTGVEGGAAPPAGTVGHPPPSAPVMTEEEAEYLWKLGLMDRRR